MKTVSFVSLGPGALEHVTLGAVKALTEAEAIVCAGRRCAAIVGMIPGLEPRGLEVWEVPMTAEAESVYERMADRIAELYAEGLKVAVTVEGDMSLYSSMHYVLEMLRDSGVEVEKVAGVPALAAASSLAGLHLVKKDERLCVVPGNATAMELDDMVSEGTAMVIMKASRCRDAVMELLAHRPTLEFYYLESVGTDKEYMTSDVADLVDRRFPYFSIILIPSQK